jgi:tetratricopeptide (TPR) repeat protein
LSMEYTFTVPERWIDPWVVCGVLGAVVSALGFFWANRRSTAVFLGLVWFLAFWLPTSNLFGHLSYFAADRYWYSPIVGLTLLASYGLWRLLRENLKLFAVLALLLLSLLGGKTWQQQGLWCDADKFYEHMHRVNPESVEGLIGLGNIAQTREDYREATDYLQKAFQRSPGNARITQNLGYVAYMRGQYNAALGYFQRAIAIKPKMVEAYNNLGSVYDDLGRTEEAIDVLEKALAINPHYEKAYTNLGVVYEKLGQLQKAESLHRRALAERPDYGQAHYHLGNTLYHAGRKQEAMQSFLMATQYSPENADALYNYAVVASELDQRGVLPSTLAKLRSISPQLADQLEKELQ